jgi:mRNA-degrading endonuclease toxin of MazEF toxin-antitoxin module
MARRLARGEIWLYEFHKPDKGRPVVIISRQEVIALIDTVMVAPVRSSIRGAPSEVVVGTAEGLKHDSGISRALAVATGCS